jgi:hypothetical protein
MKEKRRILFVFALVLVTASSGAGAQNGNKEFGYFVGTVVTKWITPDREMELVEDFAYVDPAGVTWRSPKGSVIDGASIPRPLWSLIGSPFTGAYRNASVIHDVACERRTRTSTETHLMFYYALLAGGVELKQAKMMFAGVYHFGPWWNVVQMNRPGELTPQKLGELQRFIDTDPSIEAIRRYPISNRAR